MLTAYRHGFVVLVGAATLTVAAACGHGEPTNSTCPPSSTLTYANFGKPFMDAYCTRCHSSTKTGSARQDAPADHNFDTLNGVLTFAAHIDEHAAAGPAGTNTDMPPSDPSPSDDERRKLGEWLACERAPAKDAGTD